MAQTSTILSPNKKKQGYPPNGDPKEDTGKPSPTGIEAEPTPILGGPSVSNIPRGKPSNMPPTPGIYAGPPKGGMQGEPTIGPGPAIMGRRPPRGGVNKDAFRERFLAKQAENRSGGKPPQISAQPMPMPVLNNPNIKPDFGMNPGNMGNMRGIGQRPPQGEGLPEADKGNAWFRGPNGPEQRPYIPGDMGKISAFGGGKSQSDRMMRNPQEGLKAYVNPDRSLSTGNPQIDSILAGRTPEEFMAQMGGGPQQAPPQQEQDPSMSDPANQMPAWQRARLRRNPGGGGQLGNPGQNMMSINGGGYQPGDIWASSDGGQNQITPEMQQMYDQMRRGGSSMFGVGAYGQQPNVQSALMGRRPLQFMQQ